MLRSTTLILATVYSVCLNCASADDLPELQFKSSAARLAAGKFDASVKNLRDGYDKEFAKTGATYREAMTRYKSAIVAALQNAQTEATKAADLDEALKMRNAIETYKNYSTEPPVAGTTQDSQGARKRIAELEKELAQFKANVEREFPYFTKKCEPSAVLGVWDHLGKVQTTFRPDFYIIQGTTRAPWRMLDGEDRLFQVKWSSKNTVNLRLSPCGNVLYRTDGNEQALWAARRQ